MTSKISNLYVSISKLSHFLPSFKLFEKYIFFSMMILVKNHAPSKPSPELVNPPF